MNGVGPDRMVLCPPCGQAFVHELRLSGSRRSPAEHFEIPHLVNPVPGFRRYGRASRLSRLQSVVHHRFQAVGPIMNHV